MTAVGAISWTEQLDTDVKRVTAAVEKVHSNCSQEPDVGYRLTFFVVFYTPHANPETIA
jgi:hypothetical protein